MGSGFQISLRGVLLPILITLADPTLAAVPCPLDRIVFKDKESGREFIAQRVAVDFQYLCEGKKIIGHYDRKHYSRPQKNLDQDCDGPAGDTIIEGLLDGERVFAIYTTELRALPCCSWYSYPGDDRNVTKKVKEWLTPEKVPLIELDDGTTLSPIGVNDPAFPPDTGPMGGGNFIPTSCRSG